nr:PREDICTED: uroplakin-3a [Latimeria chalumnae]|eukprot:XP_014342534.1 PREDICTED: uroplakin-3a [Latimeria chalumnae]
MWRLLAIHRIGDTILCPITAQFPKPEIANPQFVAGNPTLTTISLEKPFCVFDRTISASSGDFTVAVFAVKSTVAVAENINDFTQTYQSSREGTTAPYKAASFAVPNCDSPLVLSNPVNVNVIRSLLNQYLIRIGDDTMCSNMPGICNGPLTPNTAYRFKFVLLNGNRPAAQTPWSSMISTRKSKPFEDIDTWPGKRTGGQVVVTTILVILLFLLLCGFVTTLVASILGKTIFEPPTVTETVQPSTRAPQETQQKNRAFVESTYSMVTKKDRTTERKATGQYTLQNTLLFLRIDWRREVFRRILYFMFNYH